MAVWKCAGRNRLTEDGEPYCDYEAPRAWMGRCPNCGRLYDAIKVGANAKSTRATLATLANAPPKPRLSTGFSGFDEVLGGGGIVRGSTALISGPPGCGKSTLLLSTANNIATESRTVIYASGEQKAEAVGDIAQRIGAMNEKVIVMGLEGDIYKVCEEAQNQKAVFMVIDSLQTAFMDDCKGEEGSSTQCKAVANYLTWWAPRHNVAVLIVSHVNKDGDLAGPKAAEHLVDTILEFDPSMDEDGELDEKLRMLSAGKNRHGASGVKAMFEMTAEGVKGSRKKSLLTLV